MDEGDSLSTHRPTIRVHKLFVDASNDLGHSRIGGGGNW
jgi:hypothetical protein